MKSALVLRHQIIIIRSSLQLFRLKILFIAPNYNLCDVTLNFKLCIYLNFAVSHNFNYAQKLTEFLSWVKLFCYRYMYL